MDNRLQATFMPRQSAVTGEAYVRPKGPPNFLMIIGVVVFLLTLAAIGGLFFYKGYVEASNDEKKAQIEEAIQNFEPELTKELTTLKARVDAGRYLLEGHKAISVFFSLLGANTAQTVRFRDMNISIGNDKTLTLSMEGEARSYNAIAFQSDAFSKVEYIKNPIFSDLVLDEDGLITFNVTAQIDPAAVSYKKLFPGSQPEEDELPLPDENGPSSGQSGQNGANGNGAGSSNGTSTASSTNQTGS
jgi:hypothetical protein